MGYFTLLRFNKVVSKEKEIKEIPMILVQRDSVLHLIKSQADLNKKGNKVAVPAQACTTLTQR